MMRQFYEFDHIPFDPDAASGALEQFLDNSFFGGAWKICDESATVGYIVITFGYSLEFRGRDAFIDELYIQDGYRGKGIGKQAIKFAEEVCRSASIEALHLEVTRDNLNALAVYRIAGFIDHDRYLMTRWIPKV